MVKMVKQGGKDNIPVEEWYADKETDLNLIPDETPIFSYCLVIESTKVFIKNSSGRWIEL